MKVLYVNFQGFNPFLMILLLRLKSEIKYVTCLEKNTFSVHYLFIIIVLVKISHFLHRSVTMAVGNFIGLIKQIQDY